MECTFDYYDVMACRHKKGLGKSWNIEPDWSKTRCGVKGFVCSIKPAAKSMFRQLLQLEGAMEILGLNTIPHVPAPSGARHEDVQCNFLEVIGTLADSREVEVDLQTRAISVQSLLLSPVLHKRLCGLDVFQQK